MERIDTITLEGTLPDVFAGAETDEPVCRSEVWRRRVILRRGENYLIMAESGTGKSSLCSFIYGNRSDYSGTISFNGTDIRTLGINEWCDIRRRHIALLPQEMRLFGELTVMENITIKNRLTDRYSEHEIMAMLREVEIDHKAGQRAGLLSIGQQQRAATVRALCQPFDFIILDEPVSHLDARNNGIVAAMVTRVAAEAGASVVATSVGNHLLLENPRTLNL